jgi:hypothetical protein
MSSQHDCLVLFQVVWVKTLDITTIQKCLLYSILARASPNPYCLDEYVKVGKYIIQRMLGLFVDEQRRKVGEGKGGKVGEPWAQCYKTFLSVIQFLEARL